MSGTLGAIDPTKTTDHYDLDDGDANFPIYVPYIPPAQLQGLIRATLSWKRKPFRATANLNPSSMSTDASGETGHSHSHAHTLAIAGGLAINENLQVESTNGAGPLGTPGVAFNDNATVQANAAGSSGHNHSHTHTLTGSSALIVTEGGIATVTAISFDGLDRTAALGGPWSGDMVELDVSALLLTTPAMWHEIALTLSGQGRLVTLLRIYYTT